ncbi:hypothetical protein BCR32DRAFT_239968 [Anaeromyces robustus]|uniref:Uncharacterized protein n=1 Tax=Anaeromyces robustus TaxID=1754192 RepID=A0A1Y1XPL2_9FUNG|nr:hypothetical protein BCR32DRAFT_239968 [Anaeromyces robustus]|eukprot:ORX87671.1 hypothetical protein BCR32DRAFT_239968 [Anaeromyces robustus]
MDNINELAISIQKIVNSPILIHSYNILSKFIDIASTVMDQVADIVDKFIENHGNSDIFLYKMHKETKNLFNVLPWPKIILIICLSLLLIKIIQATFSWLYKSVKFMMKTFIISVVISIIIVYLIETGTEKYAIK